MDKYLLSLFNSKDMELCLVDKETFEWIINDEFNTNDEGHDLTIPESLKKRMWESSQKDQYTKNDYPTYESFHVEVGKLSYQNDRALDAVALLADNTFFSIKKLIEFVKANDIHIVEEYEGYIY